MQKFKTILYHMGSWFLFILQLCITGAFGYQLNSVYHTFDSALVFDCIGFAFGLNLIFYGAFGKYAYPLMKKN